MKKEGMFSGGSKLVGVLGIGRIESSSSNLNIRIWIQKLKVLREMLSPCGRPRPREILHQFTIF